VPVRPFAKQAGWWCLSELGATPLDDVIAPVAVLAYCLAVFVVLNWVDDAAIMALMFC
jgi:hypothetical protein